MNYHRVLPRDLFNEAKLLKCLGQLCLKIHDQMAPEGLGFDHDAPGTGFHIMQDPATGYLSVENLRIYNREGYTVEVFTHYNSRDPYPLWFSLGDEDGPVFTDAGEFTDEFKEAVQ